MPPKVCEMAECDGVVMARGFCRSHYNRWYYTGSPERASEVDSCLECGGLNPPKPISGPRSKYCSRACSSRASYARNAKEICERDRARSAAARVEQVCVACSCVFVPPKSRRQIYCSRLCATRTTRSARRAKLSGSAEVERLHWRLVFDQDGPDCHLCDLPTDPTDFDEVDGVYFRAGLAYPSLDHVVPLARGGQHIRANVRLAHFYCNSVKSDRLVA